MVALTISRTSNGKAIKDSLISNEKGLNHGEIGNGGTTLEEVLYVRHDGLNPILNVKTYISNPGNILQWGTDITGDGLLLDIDNNGSFETNFSNSLGNSLLNAINIGTINSGQEKVVRFKVKVPDSESVVSVNKFNLNFDFDFTS